MGGAFHFANALWRSVADTGQAVCGNGERCDTGLPKVPATAHNLQVGLAALFGIVGAISVLMVVVGGFQFVTSQGDPQAAAKARMTIVYAVIGLVVAISAEAIVGFVIGKF